jgi:hypothetical protein
MLKKSNKAIKEKLLEMLPPNIVIELILALGYVDLDDEHYCFVGEHYSGLAHGAFLIDDVAMELRMLTMTDEERKKQEIINYNKKEYQAKMKAEAEFKRNLQE